MGLDAATEALRWGVNDLGGTLMEESISRMAGSYHGVRLEPEQLVAAAHAAGRPAAERTTLYERPTPPSRRRRRMSIATTLVLPVKTFGRAKTRIAAAVEPRARAGSREAMVTDVLPCSARSGGSTNCSSSP